MQKKDLVTTKNMCFFRKQSTAVTCGHSPRARSWLVLGPSRALLLPVGEDGDSPRLPRRPPASSLWILWAYRFCKIWKQKANLLSIPSLETRLFFSRRTGRRRTSRQKGSVVLCRSMQLSPRRTAANFTSPNNLIRVGRESTKVITFISLSKLLVCHSPDLNPSSSEQLILNFWRFSKNNLQFEAFSFTDVCLSLSLSLSQVTYMHADWTCSRKKIIALKKPCFMWFSSSKSRHKCLKGYCIQHFLFLLLRSTPSTFPYSGYKTWLALLPSYWRQNQFNITK